MSKADESTEKIGPIEDRTWPREIQAHVVSAGSQPAIHGFDVQNDLALHYSFSDLVFLSATGELPGESQSKAFEVALIFLAPVTVAQAPGHAARLAQVSGSTTSGVLTCGALALAEQVRFITQEHAELLSWFEDTTGLFPSSCVAQEGQRAAVARLTKALGSFSLRVSEHDPTMMAVLFDVLHACGLCRPEQFETVLFVSRFAQVAAEAFAVPQLSFKDYPITLPPFVYEGQK